MSTEGAADNADAVVAGAVTVAVERNFSADSACTDEVSSQQHAAREPPSSTEREERIRVALARGEAPIKPEFLVVPGSQAKKRAAPEPEASGATEKEDPSVGGAGAEAPAEKKRKRGGQHKAKERSSNAMAMKTARALQLCSRMAYVNVCEAHMAQSGSADAGAGDGSALPACKQNHDLEACAAARPPAIEEDCPVLKRNGVCPAGLNCRFRGHVVDGKNVDKDGQIVTPQSEWCQKVPGVQHPVGESNIFTYDLIRKLRQRTFDFSRSQEVVKAWHRHCSSGSKDSSDIEQPLGGLVPPERRPLDFSGKTILAPLTTVGNLPFRRLCVKLGCEVTVGEMALSTTILEGGPAELALLRRHESEKCFGVQVAGGDVEVMTKVAQFVEDEVDCDFMDINCGCPLDEVHRRGAGSRLMDRRKHLEGMVRGMSSVLRTKHLTLKMRTAHLEDKKAEDFKEFHGRYAHRMIPLLEDWGVSALTIHGRTSRQRYTKLADWSYIHECGSRRVKRTPLVGGGDVLSWQEAQDHLENHGVDAIMVGRGALMKPWLFKEIADKRDWDISASERFDLIKDFTHFGLDHWGSDARGVETTRRFLLEWLSFTCRYVPLGLLEVAPPKINWRPRAFVGRSELETKLSSQNAKDWVDISEMLLGKVPDGFTFIPKHKSASYEKDGATATAGDAVGEAG
mmetsp:Transcript_66843/g.159981  ORF Transcript_66843/g.159981 Transcript_66843/m.159981 type:complete len:683 (-) Transcript_66843:90-2138(-)